ncbi:MAG: hypothetical protein Kow0069_34120 [Promethearchaeota archaeon]
MPRASLGGSNAAPWNDEATGGPDDPYFEKRRSAAVRRVLGALGLRGDQLSERDLARALDQMLRKEHEFFSAVLRAGKANFRGRLAAFRDELARAQRQLDRALRLLDEAARALGQSFEGVAP